MYDDEKEWRGQKADVDFDPTDPHMYFVRRYTEGDCAMLAQAIEMLTGWPAYAYWCEGCYDNHVFNRMPDGKRIDIEGPRYKKEFDQMWTSLTGTTVIRRVDWQELEHHWGDMVPDDETITVAARLVAYLTSESV